MTLDDFLYHAKKLNDMGWAVGDQLQAIVDHEGLEHQNPNALKMICNFLKEVAPDLTDDRAEDLVSEITDHLNGDKKDEADEDEETADA